MAANAPLMMSLIQISLFLLMGSCACASRINPVKYSTNAKSDKHKNVSGVEEQHNHFYNSSAFVYAFMHLFQLYEDFVVNK
jgi:hypothetical protein